jgi:hypothetical protein
MFFISSVLRAEAIDLGNNLFTGGIPTEVGSIARLEYFSLNNNSFMGTLPRELALLTNLSKLSHAWYKFQSKSNTKTEINCSTNTFSILDFI